MPRAEPGTFCFVHAADLHLDTPFHGLHETAPHVAAELREASLDAFDQIVALTIEREAAFLLVAGDVYDGAERGLRAQLRFRDGLERLARAGIASFVVHGNHDPVQTGWSAVSSWPELVTVFPSDDVVVREVHRDGERLATVQGISYPTPAVTENLARRFARPEGGGLAIGLLHCNVAGVADGYANYSPCTLEELHATGLDYLALGHIHQRRTLSGPDGTAPWVVYPGNSQARSPRRSEMEPKGAVVVSVESGRVTGVEFVACDRVRFEEIEVPTGDLADLAELAEVLEEHGRASLRRAEGRSVVLRARLVGASGLHLDLGRPGVLDDLLVAVRDRERPEVPFLWWDELADATTSEIDLDEIRRRGDFAADLLGLAEELNATPTARDELLGALLAAAPRSLAEVCRTLLSDPDRSAELVDRATRLALEQLGTAT